MHDMKHFSWPHVRKYYIVEREWMEKSEPAEAKPKVVLCSGVPIIEREREKRGEGRRREKPRAQCIGRS